MGIEDIQNIGAGGFSVGDPSLRRSDSVSSQATALSGRVFSQYSDEDVAEAAALAQAKKIKVVIRGQDGKLKEVTLEKERLTGWILAYGDKDQLSKSLEGKSAQRFTPNAQGRYDCPEAGKSLVKNANDTQSVASKIFTSMHDQGLSALKELAIAQDLETSGSIQKEDKEAERELTNIRATGFDAGDDQSVDSTSSIHSPDHFYYSRLQERLLQETRLSPAVRGGQGTLEGFQDRFNEISQSKKNERLLSTQLEAAKGLKKDIEAFIEGYEGIGLKEEAPDLITSMQKVLSDLEAMIGEEQTKLQQDQLALDTTAARQALSLAKSTLEKLETTYADASSDLRQKIDDLKGQETITAGSGGLAEGLEEAITKYNGLKTTPPEGAPNEIKRDFENLFKDAEGVLKSFQDKVSEKREILEQVKIEMGKSLRGNELATPLLFAETLAQGFEKQINECGLGDEDALKTGLQEGLEKFKAAIGAKKQEFTSCIGALKTACHTNHIENIQKELEKAEGLLESQKSKGGETLSHDSVDALQKQVEGAKGILRHNQEGIEKQVQSYTDQLTNLFDANGNPSDGDLDHANEVIDDASKFAKGQDTTHNETIAPLKELVSAARGKCENALKTISQGYEGQESSLDAFMGGDALSVDLRAFRQEIEKAEGLASQGKRTAVMKQNLSSKIQTAQEKIKEFEGAQKTREEGIKSAIQKTQSEIERLKGLDESLINCMNEDKSDLKKDIPLSALEGAIKDASESALESSKESQGGVEETSDDALQEQRGKLSEIQGKLAGTLQEANTLLTQGRGYETDANALEDKVNKLEKKQGASIQEWQGVISEYEGKLQESDLEIEKPLRDALDEVKGKFSEFEKSIGEKYTKAQSSISQKMEDVKDKKEKLFDLEGEDITVDALDAFEGAINTLSESIKEGRRLLGDNAQGDDEMCGGLKGVIEGDDGADKALEEARTLLESKQSEMSTYNKEITAYKEQLSQKEGAIKACLNEEMTDLNENGSYPALKNALEEAKTLLDDNKHDDLKQALKTTYGTANSLVTVAKELIESRDNLIASMGEGATNVTGKTKTLDHWDEELKKYQKIANDAPQNLSGLLKEQIIILSTAIGEVAKQDHEECGTYGKALEDASGPLKEMISGQGKNCQFQKGASLGGLEDLKTDLRRAIDQAKGFKEASFPRQELKATLNSPIKHAETLLQNIMNAQENAANLEREQQAKKEIADASQGITSLIGGGELESSATKQSLEAAIKGAEEVQRTHSSSEENSFQNELEGLSQAIASGKLVLKNLQKKEHFKGLAKELLGKLESLKNPILPSFETRNALLDTYRNQITDSDKEHAQSLQDVIDGGQGLFMEKLRAFYDKKAKELGESIGSVVEKATTGNVKLLEARLKDSRDNLTKDGALGNETMKAPFDALQTKAEKALKEAKEHLKVEEQASEHAGELQTLLGQNIPSDEGGLQELVNNLGQKLELCQKYVRDNQAHKGYLGPLEGKVQEAQKKHQTLSSQLQGILDAKSAAEKKEADFKEKVGAFSSQIDGITISESSPRATLDALSTLLGEIDGYLNDQAEDAIKGLQEYKNLQNKVEAKRKSLSEVEEKIGKKYADAVASLEVKKGDGDHVSSGEIIRLSKACKKSKKNDKKSKKNDKNLVSDSAPGTKEQVEGLKKVRKAASAAVTNHIEALDQSLEKQIEKIQAGEENALESRTKTAKKLSKTSLSFKHLDAAKKAIKTAKTKNEECKTLLQALDEDASSVYKKMNEARTLLDHPSYLTKENRGSLNEKFEQLQTDLVNNVMGPLRNEETSVQEMQGLITRAENFCAQGFVDETFKKNVQKTISTAKRKIEKKQKAAKATFTKNQKAAEGIFSRCNQVDIPLEVCIGLKQELEEAACFTYFAGANENSNYKELAKLGLEDEKKSFVATTIEHLESKKTIEKKIQAHMDAILGQGVLEATSTSAPQNLRSCLGARKKIEGQLQSLQNSSIIDDLKKPYLDQIQEKINDLDEQVRGLIEGKFEGVFKQADGIASASDVNKAVNDANQALSQVQGTLKGLFFTDSDKKLIKDLENQFYQKMIASLEGKMQVQLNEWTGKLEKLEKEAASLKNKGSNASNNMKKDTLKNEAAQLMNKIKTNNSLRRLESYKKKITTGANTKSSSVPNLGRTMGLIERCGQIKNI